MINQIEETALKIRCGMLMLFIFISIFICFYFFFTKEDTSNTQTDCSMMAFWPPDMVPHGPHFPQPKEPKQPSA